MEDIVIKIRSLYSKMGRGEKKIADFILDNQQSIIGLSISELSSACGCGDATIVRFSRRLGLSGYQALKISIAQQSDSISHNSGIEKGDSCYEIFLKRKNDIALTLENTKNVLDEENLETAADKIMNADKIIVLGLGNSASVALDAQHKFLRAGLNATAYSDNHMQAIAVSHVKKGDIVIGISHSGSSIDIVQALKIAKENGACTICVTNHGNSPIQKQSDIILFTDAEETKYSILAMSSRIAQLAIFDSIYSYIVLNSSEKVIKELNATEYALQDKKY